MSANLRSKRRGTVARALLPIALPLCALPATAQLTVSPQTNVQALARAISGPGVRIQNPVIACHAQGYGEFRYTGSVLGGITEGVLLTTGTIDNALGPNNVSNKTFEAGTAGNALLNTVTGRTTFDACRLEFDIIPGGDTLRFNFALGSEEYHEWVGSQYNDVFGFFISGPGITGDPGIGNERNIARVPGSSQPVTINNVNNGSNQAWFRDNTGNSQVQYDGITKGLQAVAVVQPCQTYRLKLIVADASDRKFDSGVFIEKIQSNSVTMQAFTASGFPNLVEGCNAGTVRFTRQHVTNQPLTVPFFLRGTAINGTDYTQVGDANPLTAKTAVIPANQASVNVQFNPIADGIPEGIENIRVLLGTSLCPGFYLDSLDLLIQDSLFAAVNTPAPICTSGSRQLNASGGLSYSWSPSTGLSAANIANPVASPSATTTYTVTVSAGACTSTATTTVRVSGLSLSGQALAPLCNGASNGAVNLTVSNGIAPFTFAWSGPGGFTAGTEDLVNVGPGTYGVTVTDAAGCTRSQSFNVNAPAALSLTLAPSILPFGQNISCSGGSDGSINLTVNGGKAPYAFAWTGPNGFTANNEDISGLRAGAYTVVVTDANGCTSTASRTLVEPPALVPAIGNVTHAACFGSATGSATASVSGGIPPYSYAWNTVPAQNTATATGLPGGTWTVTITDGYGCISQGSVTIQGSTTPIAIAFSGVTDVRQCQGQQDPRGEATASASGGTGPYSYTWNTVPPQGAATAEFTSGGTWTVTATGANGCTGTASVTVSQTSQPAATIASQQNVLCHGGATGSATVQVTGGANVQSIAWNTIPPQSGATATDLSAGVWTVTAQHADGCQTTASVTISGPAAPLSATITSSGDVNCFGGSDGSATVTATGGSGPYTYAWNTTPAQSGENATGLPAGSHTVTVSDANGCTVDTTVTLAQPDAIVLAGDIVTASCQGSSTGAVNATVAGGSGPYTIAWSGPPNGGFTAGTLDIVNLPSGVYTLSITDAKGCTASRSYDVGEPGMFQVDGILGEFIGGWNTSCPDAADGSIGVTVLGGTGPYGFQWSGPGGFASTDANINGLGAGTYTVSITDANGCATLATWTLNAPPAIGATLTPGTHNGQHVSCNGAADGSINTAITGGAAPYAVQWNGPNGFSSNDEDINGLEAGGYTVAITDANGCVFNSGITLDAPGAIVLGIDVSTHGGGSVSCAGAADGTVDLTISGGTAPHTIAWSDGTGFTSGDANPTGLGAGVYDVIVTDANGCTAQNQVTLTAPQPLDLTASIPSFNGHQVNCHGGSDGSIDLNVAGGTAPFTFLWDNGSSDEDLSGIGAGTYTVVVTDANGCTATVGHTLTEPDALHAAPVAGVRPGGFSVSCAEAVDGDIATTIDGGIAPYTIAWTGPNSFTSNNADINGLAAGGYTLTVTDANGCTFTSNVTLTAPAPVTVQLNSTTYNGGHHVRCAGGTTGSITASAGGGIPGHTYDWSGPGGFTSTDANLNGLQAGTYNVTVTDANGCTATNAITLTEPAALDISALLSDAGHGQQIGCAGNDGAIDVTVTGGTPQYNFGWNGPGGFGSTAEDISGLGAGTYTLTVTDANGCVSTRDIVLNAPDALDATLTTNQNTCPGDATGGIGIALSGGVAPYTFDWSGPGGFTSTDADLSGIVAGSYTVGITDAMGCTASFTTVLDGPAPLGSGTYVSFYGQYNLKCNGDSSGVIELSPRGGTAPYTVQVDGPPSGGFTSSDTLLNGLRAGGYNVRITDAHGCTMDTLITLTEPPVPITTSLDVSVFPSGTNVSCHGFNDGWINATVTGGTGPYTFTWRGPDSLTVNTALITGLTAGNYVYELVVTDVNQCSFFTHVTLTQPDSAIHADIVTSQFNGGFQVRCDGANDGAINLNASGGNGGFTYLWNGPGGFTSTDADLDSLIAGTYIVVVTDTNGCQLTDTVRLAAPDPLIATLGTSAFPSGNAISCHGANDGSITATITGGAPGYTLAWTGPNGFTSNDTVLSALAPGNYCLTVTDANGCMSQTCAVLTEPALLSANASAQPATCGRTIGAVDLNVSGGSAPYAYLWNNGASTRDLSGLDPGTYSVTVTDLNGCTATAQAIVDGTPAVDATASVTDNRCHGGTEGRIVLNVLGGTAPFTYAWNNGETGRDLLNIGAGGYDVLVTDANGCTWSGAWTVTENSPLVVDTTLSRYNGYNVSTWAGSDGSIRTSVSGGTPPYTYRWSNGASTHSQYGLPAGTYGLEVTDANGCTVFLTITLTRPDDLRMPTGFSPNGDGANDVFVILGLDAYPNNQLVIVNRWGNAVYERLNYRNDWNGENMRGEALPNGTYFAILKVNEGERTLQGYVDLRR